MNRTVYLPSYDRYVEILAYQLPEGRFTLLSRSDFLPLGIPLAFGNFTREGDNVAGIFASPQGPVCFLNERHIVGRYGSTSAIVEPDPPGSRMRFTLTHEETSGEKINLILRYEGRIGIGANPYDNTVEDVDLCAMIASGLDKEQFFRTYARDWTAY